MYKEVEFDKNPYIAKKLLEYSDLSGDPINQNLLDYIENQKVSNKEIANLPFSMNENYKDIFQELVLKKGRLSIIVNSLNLQNAFTTYINYLIYTQPENAYIVVSDKYKENIEFLIENYTNFKDLIEILNHKEFENFILKTNQNPERVLFLENEQSKNNVMNVLSERVFSLTILSKKETNDIDFIISEFFKGGFAKSCEKIMHVDKYKETRNMKILTELYSNLNWDADNFKNYFKLQNFEFDSLTSTSHSIPLLTSEKSFSRYKSLTLKEKNNSRSVIKEYYDKLGKDFKQGYNDVIIKIEQAKNDDINDFNILLIYDLDNISKNDFHELYINCKKHNVQIIIIKDYIDNAKDKLNNLIQGVE